MWSRKPLLNIGFGNVVSMDKVVAIINSGSLPVKRLKDDAKQRGKLIDATQGRKTRAILITDSNHIILSAIAVDTIVQRLKGKEKDV